MIPFNYHCHTTYVDGKNTAEEMIESAICSGGDSFGISEHYVVEYDPVCSMKMEVCKNYLSEILELKEKYKGRISLFAGVEIDYFSPEAKGYDYIIGSVHYLKLGDECVPVDLSADAFIRGAKKYFSGDCVAFACEYFKTLIKLSQSASFDIVGHLDLVTKFNEGDVLFDTNDPAYISAMTDAIDALIPTGAIFEINTGAISRGYRTTPYPSPKALEYIKSRGGRVTFSSDAHSRENVFFGFDEAVELAKRSGFKNLMKFGENGFYEVEIQ